MPELVCSMNEDGLKLDLYCLKFYQMDVSLLHRTIVVSDEGTRLSLRWELFAALINYYDPVIKDDSLGCLPFSSSIQFGKSSLESFAV